MILKAIFNLILILIWSKSIGSKFYFSKKQLMMWFTCIYIPPCLHSQFALNSIVGYPLILGYSMLFMCAINTAGYSVLHGRSSWFTYRSSVIWWCSHAVLFFEEDSWPNLAICALHAFQGTIDNFFFYS